MTAIFLCGPVLASSSHRESEIFYTRAETMQRHLEAKPLSARTYKDYERALDTYRAVYHGDPASPDADRSIAAVADLLAREGRSFHEAKLSRDAVAQWEFLRQQYPRSPLRQRALFQEAEIEQNDLHNRAAAKKIYRSFLMLYPHNPLAEEARANMSGAKASSERMLYPYTASRANAPKEQSIFERASTAPAESFSDAAQRESVAHPLIRKNPTAAAFHPSAPQPVSPRPVFLVDKNVSRLRSAQSTSSSGAPTAILQGVRYWMEGNSTRLAVDMSNAVPYHAYLTPNGKQITLVFFGAHPSASLISHLISVQHDANLCSIRAMILTGDQAELVLELSRPARFSSFVLSNPDRLILDVQATGQRNLIPTLTRTSASTPHFTHPKTPLKTVENNPAPAQVQPRSVQRAAAVPAIDATEQTVPTTLPETPLSAEPALSAEPTANGQRSMARVLGLRVRRIVIDPGHGGHDSGTLGPGGLEEKDVALDVALRLGHLLHQRLGADVIYTRRTDTFVPLEERTAIANRAHADLFLSIHANSSSDPGVRGVETYYLNFTASPDALQVAARENAISNRSVHELSDLVRKIALSDKIDESREFAVDMQQSLYGGLATGNPGLKNRGVKQAPFVVLIGANMPSILAEISFLTNPEDASELAQPAYRERLAESLYRGVAEYVDGMSGIRVAKTAPPETLLVPAE